MKSGVSLDLQQLDGITGAMCRSAVLLEDKHVACYLLDGRNHLLRQQDSAVVLAINFHSRVDKQCNSSVFKRSFINWCLFML